jgi:hypothetical protein
MEEAKKRGITDKPTTVEFKPIVGPHLGGY